jgi:hypothetical protein
MTGRNSREFGVFFVVASERCYFLESYGVFWSDFLPMRCFCVKIDDPFSADSRFDFHLIKPASLANAMMKNSSDVEPSPFPRPGTL